MIDFNYTLLIQFLNLIVVLILLKVFLFKPFLAALARREAAVSSAIEKAQTFSGDTRDFERRYDEGMKEKRKPIVEGRDAEISKAHETAMRLIDQARAELSEELTRLRAEIAADSQKMLDSLKKDVEKLSNEAAEKILNRSVA